ncbi:MAG TPA: APC family permease [Candidatus Acidoferrales bacterium]|nr:APC family permease [Candidatus Acidoferrales bacterium]
MTELARKLRLVDYFSLGFGTMVGVGWLVVMDDWLGRGGPAGAILGFALGGAALVPVGYVYGRLISKRPDAAGEVAYTAAVFPRWASYWTGWMMVLAYAIVCPWEAVAFGRVAAFIFPALDSAEIYRVAGSPVHLPHVALGLALTAVLALLNYRGIRQSATFQNVATFGLFLLFAVFGAAGVTHGSAQNFRPLWSHAPGLSILLALQIVPYFMTGFESTAKSSEEAHPEFPQGHHMYAPLMAIAAAVVFYCAVIAVVAWAQPWQSVAGENFPTAVALERAVGSRWVVNVILAAALLSLVKVFNGNFVASTRLLFAMARRGLLPRRFAAVHPRFQTPSTAVAAVAAGTALASLAGSQLLVPISEVGSFAAGFGWMMACAAYWAMRPSTVDRALAAAGALVGASLLFMKLLPAVPGHFTRWEFGALALWILLGWAMHRRDAVATGSQQLKRAMTSANDND